MFASARGGRIRPPRAAANIEQRQEEGGRRRGVIPHARARRRARDRYRGAERDACLSAVLMLRLLLAVLVARLRRAVHVVRLRLAIRVVRLLLVVPELRLVAAVIVRFDVGAGPPPRFVSRRIAWDLVAQRAAPAKERRSEEHTSELQPRFG